jgi:hypothetical protein
VAKAAINAREQPLNRKMVGAGKRGLIEDWQFETEPDNSGTKHGLWWHSMNGGVDAVCLFIQHLLQKFAPKSYVTF